MAESSALHQTMYARFAARFLHARRDVPSLSFPGPDFVRKIMTNTAPSFRYRWVGKGDINRFFALAIDNLALLVGMAGILMGVFHLPAEVVLGKMVPGTAFGVLVGDLLYTWLAFRLAKRAQRQDVCAMPLGIDAPSMFALSFGVVGPAFIATHDAHKAWAVGMAVLVIMGLGKLVAHLPESGVVPVRVFVGMEMADQAMRVPWRRSRPHRKGAKGQRAAKESRRCGEGGYLTRQARRRRRTSAAGAGVAGQVRQGRRAAGLTKVQRES
jgi:hypothetical protein